ncbi:Protein NLP3 [Vitis vinifera]|uniref:Protein NLP3 n=1 Tax=Vitis vinifera TaxID=29760 RepID=A0A438EY56_VITVI|nr:Protein NLP3 [Vitis vinifera]
MTDPLDDVPYHDPFSFDLPLVLVEDLNFSDPPNPNLSDIPSLVKPDSNPYLIPQSSDELADNTIDPFKDSFAWELCDDSNGDNPQLTPMEVHGETSSQAETSQQQIPSSENSVPLPVWPLPPVPYGCSCCQILREIIHTNGTYTTKLEVHGRPGLISHAVLESHYCAVDGIPPDHHMFDFCKKSIEGVKQFLQQYCKERRQAGFAMLQDPLSLFYEAICVGLDYEESMNADEFFQRSPSHSGGCQINHPETEAENRSERTQKIPLAAQRERTGKLTIYDFTRYFHLPIDKAAEGLNICPTVVKKICRKHGVDRWPYRKVKSIQRQMVRLKPSLRSKDAAERARAQTEMERLKQEMTNACGGIAIPIPRYSDHDN